MCSFELHKRFFKKPLLTTVSCSFQPTGFYLHGVKTAAATQALTGEEEREKEALEWNDEMFRV